MKMMNQLVIGLFLPFLGGILFMHVLSKDIDFSEAENRKLSRMPKFTLDRLVAGDFTKEFEVYLSDQFVKKEFWTRLKVSAEKTVLKQENNGIYFGKDNYLLGKVEKPTEQLDKNSAILSDFSNRSKGLSLSVMLVPTAIEIYPEKLPPFAQSASQKETINRFKKQLNKSIKVINPYESLLHAKEEQIYFRTDHHWTMRGAYIGYVQAAKGFGFEPYKIEDFTIETVSTNFYGTHYAKVNDQKVQADKIELFKPRFDVSYELELDDKKTMVSLYDRDYLEKRDQYSLFLGGNHRKVLIRSHVKNGSKLLLVKDSYAHAIVPFLANHYEEIHMIDLRYFRESVQKYIAENKINEVLILYNVVNFSEDRNMIWLRQ